ncbi:hypothetical protein EV361DRAFT_813461, partial [Lentinula raphanica]
IPPFGRSTIRRINKHVSAMKNLAARDYEDFLQVSLPVFEGLFPAHDKEIRKLLFDLNSVHSFAKLRLHSDFSLNMLDNFITELGKSLRTFQKKVSPHYKTKELPKETSSRQRRRTAAAQRKGKQKANQNEENEPKLKLFNLSTYKIHVLGYYVRFIRFVGTTDGYTTQTVFLKYSLISLTLI